MPRPRTAWIAAVVLVLLASFRLAGYEGLDPHPAFTKYPALAESWASGRHEAGRLADVSPLYFWFHVALAKAGLPCLEGAAVIQIVLTTATAGLVFFIAWSLFGPWAGVLAGLLFGFHDMAFVYATVSEPDTAVVFFNVAALACFERFRRRGSHAWLAACGAALGLSAMLRPTAILPALVLALASAREPAGRTTGGAVSTTSVPARAARGFRRMALIAGPVGACLAMAILLNAALSGALGIMNPGPVFYEGNNPDATGYHSAYPYIVSELSYAIDAPDAHHVAYRRVAEAAVEHPVSVGETNAYWTRRAMAWARAHPGAFTAGLGRKIRLALAPWEAHDDVQSQAVSDLVWGVPLRLIVPLAAAGAFLAWTARRGRYLAGYLACYLAVLTAFYVTTRLRLPMVPVYCVLAGALVSRGLWMAPGGFFRRRAVRAVFIAAPALILCAQALRPPAVWTEEQAYWQRTGAASGHIYRAKLAMNQKRYAESCDHLQQALAADPGSIPIHQVAYLPYDVDAMLDRAGSIMASEPERSPSREFDRALLLLGRRRYADALGVIDILARAGYRPRRIYAPDSLAYFETLARLGLGEPGRAWDALTRAIEEAPGDLFVLGQAVALADRLGKTETAGRLRNELLRLHDPVSAELAMGTGRLAAGDSGGARADLSGAAARLPSVWTTHYYLLCALVREKNAPAALGEHEAMMLLRPDAGSRGTGIETILTAYGDQVENPELFVRIAGALAENGAPTTALRVLERVPAENAAEGSPVSPVRQAAESLGEAVRELASVRCGGG